MVPWSVPLTTQHDLLLPNQQPVTICRRKGNRRSDMTLARRLQSTYVYASSKLGKGDKNTALYEYFTFEYCINVLIKSLKSRANKESSKNAHN